MFCLDLILNLHYEARENLYTKTSCLEKASFQLSFRNNRFHISQCTNSNQINRQSKTLWSAVLKCEIFSQECLTALS